MAKFSQHAFIMRKTSGSTLHVFSDIEESISKQHIQMGNAGEQIHKLLEVCLKEWKIIISPNDSCIWRVFVFVLLQENQHLLGVTRLDSSEWEAYTDHVDRIILAGLSSAVRCSLQYLVDNTEAVQRIAPLFEVQQVLNGNEMTFDPPLDFTYSGNFYDIMDNMVASIIRIASFIPRVAKHNQFENYQVTSSAIIRWLCLYRVIFLALTFSLFS